MSASNKYSVNQIVHFKAPTANMSRIIKQRYDYKMGVWDYQILNLSNGASAFMDETEIDRFAHSVQPKYNYHTEFKIEDQSSIYDGVRGKIVSAGYQHNLIYYECLVQDSTKSEYKTEWSEGYLNNYAWFPDAQGQPRADCNCDIMRAFTMENWHEKDCPLQ